MQYYINPLHPPLPIIQSSPFSINTTMEPAFSQARFITCSVRRRLPQNTYTPKDLWKKSMGNKNKHQAVMFDHAGNWGQGVSMSEFYGRSTVSLIRNLDGPKDKVFAHTGLSKIIIRILWPGYEHFEWARTLEVYSPTEGHMTRAQLGIKLSEMFSRFLHKATSQSCYNGQWKIATNHIRFDHLILLGVHNIIDDVWQVDVAVDLK